MQVGLNKEPEKALSIIATPTEPGAAPMASECRTDDQGTFRLRGLRYAHVYASMGQRVCLRVCMRWLIYGLPPPAPGTRTAFA